MKLAEQYNLMSENLTPKKVEKLYKQHLSYTRKLIKGVKKEKEFSDQIDSIVSGSIGGGTANLAAAIKELQKIQKIIRP